jgi:membrane protein implicated in regulation of membrane protease activity
VVWFWVVVAAAGVLADLASGALAGVWIAAAALFALLVGLLGLPVPGQVVFFVLGAVAGLWFVRPWAVALARRPLHPPELLVGKLGTVIDPVDEGFASGRVAIEGALYVARAAPGTGLLPTGAPVRVVSVDAGEVVVERL